MDSGSGLDDRELEGDFSLLELRDGAEGASGEDGGSVIGA